MITVRILLISLLFLFICAVPDLHAEDQEKVPFRNPVPADSWTGPDKMHHFFSSAVLSGFGFVFMNSVTSKSYNKSMLYSGSVTFSIGALKELADKNSKTDHASFKDMAANVLGIGFSFLLMKSV
jgi:uncharacterized protein YfiM (DUF2279 family)